MEKLSRSQQVIIKELMKTDAWDAVLKFQSIKLDQWKSEKIQGETEFETLRSLFMREGKVEGVIELFDQLEKEAFDA